MLLRLDADQIIEYIEMTRFPIPDGEEYDPTATYGGLVARPILSANSATPTTSAKSPPCIMNLWKQA